MPFCQNMVHISTNQPFGKKKLFLGASKILKIHGHVPAISSLSKYFSAPLPLKIVIPGSIYYPLIFNFLSGPFVYLFHYSCDLYISIPHSFLET